MTASKIFARIGLVTLCGISLFLLGNSVTNSAATAKLYEVSFTPLNGTNAYGAGLLTLSGNKLSVSLHINNLETGKSHLKNIFYKENGISRCPDYASSDKNNDGSIMLDEAEDVLGGVSLALSPASSTDPVGSMTVQKTFTVDPEDFQEIEKHTIVIHGLTRNGQYINTFPVSCGSISLKEYNGSSAAYKHMFTSYLTGENQVPKVDTVSTGTAEFKVRHGEEYIDYSLFAYNAGKVTLVQVYCGNQGQKGKPVATLFEDKSGRDINGLITTDTISKGELKITGDSCSPRIETFEHFIQAMREGKLYVNVHTKEKAEGLIRGQIK